MRSLAAFWDRLMTRVWGEICPECGERKRMRECHYWMDHGDLT